MNNSKNFIKDTLNKNLSHIKVTERLKNKTIEKCKNAKINKKSFRIKIATAASLAFFTITSLTYYTFIYKTSNEQIAKNIIEKQPIKDENIENDSDKNLNINSKVENIPDDNINKKLNKSQDSNIDINTKKSTTITESPSKKKDLPSIKEDESKKSRIENAEKNITNSDKNSNEKSIALRNYTSTHKEDQLNIDNAEKFLNKKITLPSYIPEGYSLESFEKDTLSDKSIVLIYKKDSNYFKVSIKNPSNINISCVQSYQNTELTFNKDELNYSVSGNINSDVLEKICKSIKEKS